MHAQRRADVCLTRPKSRVLEVDRRLHDVVNEGLAKKWSPRQVSVGGSYQARGRRPASETAAAVLVTETDSAELDVRVRMTWQRAGHITLDSAGVLVFPELPCSPGIYRLTFTDAPGQDRPRVYVGESEDVRKRARRYRRPGPTQQTSQRIHAELVDHLHAGGTVTMAVATQATVHARDETKTLPLGRKTARVLAEHAALALTYLDGDAVIINRDSEVAPEN